MGAILSIFSCYVKFLIILGVFEAWLIIFCSYKLAEPAQIAVRRRAGPSLNQ